MFKGLEVRDFLFPCILNTPVVLVYEWNNKFMVYFSVCILIVTLHAHDL